MAKFGDYLGDFILCQSGDGEIRVQNLESSRLSERVDNTGPGTLLMRKHEISQSRNSVS